MEEKIKYHVYLVAQSNALSMRADGFVPYALFNTHREFDTDYEAEEWIKTDGYIDNTYTILSVIKGGQKH
jgi:hypothetical protein